MFKKFLVYLLMVSIVCFSYVPSILAQDTNAEGIQPEQGATETSADASPVGATSEKVAAPGNVTIDFKEADINNVLRILSIKSGVNIVAGKDVEGTVTIRLVNVPWEKALDVVLKTYGFAYEREGNIVRVATIDNLGQEPLKTEVFKISYSDAEAISESIKEMISERGSIRADKKSNTIIVTDIPTNIYKIEQVIAKLDEPTPQVYIEAKIIETRLDDDEKLGIDWTVQVTASGATIPTTMPFNTNFTRTNWLKHRIPIGEAAGDFAESEVQSFPDVSDAVTGTAAQWAFGTLDFSSFQAVLYMLDNRTDTKIVSCPRAVTLNNQEATIHVGDTIFIPEWTESSTTGSPVFSDIKKTELDTGIKLKVTPHVNSKDEIVVNLEPEISTLGTKSELLVIAGGETVYYWPVSIRTAKTQVMVKDGETIAIGGLLKEDITKVRRKVPLLGDIPLLGHLFRYSSDTIDTKDLLVFVTVKLIENKDDSVPMFKDINDRMDKFEHTSEALGHQWEPSTPIGSGKKKKKVTGLLH